MLSVLDCARKPLVLLGIIVLQGNLEFYRFNEPSLLLPRRRKNGGNGFLKCIFRDFTEKQEQEKRNVNTLEKIEKDIPIREQKIEKN